MKVFNNAILQKYILLVCTIYMYTFTGLFGQDLFVFVYWLSAAPHGNAASLGPIVRPILKSLRDNISMMDKAI